MPLWQIICALFVFSKLIGGEDSHVLSLFLIFENKIRQVYCQLI